MIKNDRLDFSRAMLWLNMKRLKKHKMRLMLVMVRTYWDKKLTLGGPLQREVQKRKGRLVSGFRLENFAHVQV